VELLMIGILVDSHCFAGDPFIYRDVRTYTCDLL